MTLGEKIEHLREAAGLSQEGLADAAQLPLRTLQRIESDAVLPQQRQLQALAQALNVPLNEFWEEPEANTWAKALSLINLLALTGVVFPYGQVIFPLMAYRVHRHQPLVQTYGNRILSFLILYTLFTSGFLVLVAVIQAPLIRAGWIARVPWVLYAYLPLGIYFVVSTLRTAVQIRAGAYHLIYPRTPVLF